MLTETTAELAAALTLAAARRVAEADVYMRGGVSGGDHWLLLGYYAHTCFGWMLQGGPSVTCW